MIAPAHPRLPADRCFWSLVDAPGVRTIGLLPEALLDELAGDLPVAVDEVFAVASPVSGDRLLVCAVRRTDLAEVSESALSLAPDSVPEELGVDADPHSLNVLVGEFEPRSLQRARVRRHAARVAIVLLAAMMVTVGVARRALHEDRIARAAGSAADALARELAPDQSPVTAVLALDQELASLRRHAQAAGVLAPPPDASVHLAGLLSNWPSQVSSKPLSLSVSPSAIMASVSIETQDTTEFLKAMHAPAGWSLDEPRMNTASGLTRVSLTMKPTSGRTARSGGENRP